MKVCVLVLGLILVLSRCEARSPYQAVLQHSRIRGRQQGPNVCAMQQIKGTDRKYFTNCKQWYHRKVCGKPTVITYECCPGYEKIPGEKGCPAALPLVNIYNTLGVVGASTTQMYSERAKLREEVEGPGSFTFFAPSNEAWAALPTVSTSHNPPVKIVPDALFPTFFSNMTATSRSHLAPEQMNCCQNTLISPPVCLSGSVTMSPDMKKLMTNHLVKQQLSSKSLYHGQELETLGGITLRVFVYRNNLCIENACIAAHDKTGRYASMFTVDKVLTPPMGTIMDILKADDRFSLLVGAIQTAGMTELLNQQRVLTFFAPTNNAFNALPRLQLNNLFRNPQELTAMLRYHLGEGVLVSGGVGSHTRVKPLQGEKLELGVRNYTVYVNKVPVADADLMATNGVVHAVDSIIRSLPPKVDREQADGPDTPLRSAALYKVEAKSFRNDDLFQKVIRSRSSRTMSQ
nr:PREDICTED: transforming growth factor-beta-induced protein ig-h3-like [Paralichthys olivaceus]